MYNLVHLLTVVRESFGDMLPALKSAFDADPSDDRMNEVYGPKPRVTVVALAVLGALLGFAFAQWGPTLPGNQQVEQYVNWPAVGAALIFAGLLRRYLFSNKPSPDDFPWLAASLIPAIALVVLLNLVAALVSGAITSSAEGSWFGALLVAITDALGVAAAMTIAIAALCFSRDWARALIDLAVRLLVFRILIWVTALVTIEIGIVGEVLGSVINGITGWTLPAWVETLADQISYAALLITAYLAVIGGTWVVCRRSMAELIETGHVDILKGIGELAQKPKKKKPGKDKKDKEKQPVA